MFDASKIAGWEPKHIANGHETKVIKEIVDKIQERLFPLDSDVDEELVGIRERVQDLISQLEIEEGGVRMVGIWGIGGSGKTTLADSVYTKIFHEFQEHCIVANIREESRNKHGLKTLQQKILSTVLKTRVKVQSVEEGKRIMKSRLCNSKVLVVLDDINDLDQLEALVGSHKWFGGGSRIIITTRDQHLLKAHRVDHVSSARLLSDKEAICLFYRHAYNATEPIKDYETLSLRVLSYAAGLPLALKVLGSFLYDKDENEWISALAKLKYIPDLKIMDILKISYDGLETLHKELFLDIACFFRWKRTYDANEILDACGFHPVIGIKVLRQKGLITTTDGIFDMHDLIQEMGHYIVRGKHPYNLEKHSRVWKEAEIENMCPVDARTENHMIEAIEYSGDSSRLCNIISNMKKLRSLSIIHKQFHRYDDDGYAEGPYSLSNELRYFYWKWYSTKCPFPDSFQPTNLAVLKLECSLQKELWNGYKHLPHLKVFELSHMENLLSTPDFDGLPYLQKLKLMYCHKLKEIHPSLGNHRNLEYVTVSCCAKLKVFPTIVCMEKLNMLGIEYCDNIREFPEIQANMGSLVRLSLNRERGGKFEKVSCRLLTRILRKSHLGCLQKLDLRDIGLREGQIPSDIAVLEADSCDSLTTIGDFYKSCDGLYDVSLVYGSIKTDGVRLLEFMLQVRAIESRGMILEIEGLAIPERFLHCLVRWGTYILQLPKNWYNDFAGFIMFFVWGGRKSPHLEITMEHVKSGAMGTDSQYDDHLAWEEDAVDKRTWVRYVPFKLLKHTLWWDETYSAVSFSFGYSYRCKGFGFALVPKLAPMETLTESCHDFSCYTPTLRIVDDTASALIISLER